MFGRERHPLMQDKQMFAILLIVVGVFGIQIALYELLKGNISLAVIYPMLIIGSFLAYKGVDKYRRIEDQEE